MYRILRNLPPGSRVLDLGCAQGSFPDHCTAASVVRIDRDTPKDKGATQFVQADAARLPFPDCLFDAVISNHSLEHFDNAKGALLEVRRVIRPGGSLYVAVPDASTLTDRLYRWLSHGGGHVNPFTSDSEVVELIEHATGLPHAGTKLLCSSLSFLNRHVAPTPPKRLVLLGGGYEWSLFLFAFVSRWMDKHFRTRASVYGWAFYFGQNLTELDTETWFNVCIRCGSGHSNSSLRVQSRLGVDVYRCPQCGATNPYFD